jgi:Skp family chaperone for outer membrane proteins
VTSHPQFKDWAGGIQKKIEDRKRAIQEKKDGKRKDVLDYIESLNKPEERLSEERKVETDVAPVKVVQNVEPPA